MWGLNIRKGGEDPAVGKDEDYPEVCAAMRGSCSDRRACASSPAIYLTSAAIGRQWVFELANELPTLAQLERVPPEERTPEQEKRIERLKRRAHIKEKNASVL